MTRKKRPTHGAIPGPPPAAPTNLLNMQSLNSHPAPYQKTQKSVTSPPGDFDNPGNFKNHYPQPIYFNNLDFSQS